MFETACQIDMDFSRFLSISLAATDKLCTPRLCLVSLLKQRLGWVVILPLGINQGGGA